MRAVNLLPRDLAKQKRISQQQLPAVVGAGLGVAVTGALALSFMSAAGHVRDAQATLKARQDEYNAIPKAATPKPPANIQLAGEQSARLAAVSTALGSRLAWDRILREFSLVLPSDVWVTSLSMTNPDPAQAAAGPQNNFTVSGYTYSHDSVARLLVRLALIPELSGINLTSSQLQEAGGTGSSAAPGAAGTVQFNITAAVKLPPGAAAAVPPPVPTPAPTTDTTSTDSTSTDSGG